MTSFKLSSYVIKVYGFFNSHCVISISIEFNAVVHANQSPFCGNLQWMFINVLDCVQNVLMDILVLDAAVFVTVKMVNHVIESLVIVPVPSVLRSGMVQHAKQVSNWLCDCIVIESLLPSISSGITCLSTRCHICCSTFRVSL